MQLDQTVCKRRWVVMEDKARTTAILVCNKVGHVLLQKRDNLPTIEEPGKWDVWGGHCEVGETPEVGAVREELGIEIADPQVLTFLMTRSVDGREECVWAYVVEADGTPPVHEGERAEWCAPEDAARLAMAFGAERLLAPEVVAQAKATRYRVTVTVRQPFADKWSPVKGVGHPTASPSDMRQPLCVRSCLCRTTQGITRIEQDIWLNAKRVVMQLSLRESSDRLMLIGGQRHLIRCRCGKVDEPDMVMRGGNRMDIQIDGWILKFPSVAMLYRLLTQDVDLKPALFRDFPKQRLFRIFVQFNVASQRKPLVELLMINQQDTVLMDHKRLNRKVHQFVHVGHRDVCPLDQNIYAAAWALSHWMHVW